MKLPKVSYLTLMFLLSACATPVTTLADKKGDTITCGGGTAGSVWGGLIGYTIQEGHDKECVDHYKDEGYKIK